jgi:hypothetical protein
MRLGIQPLLPTGNFLNKRYSIEMDFDDKSSPADNFKYLTEVVTAVHMAEFPMCYKDGKPLFSSFSTYQGEEGEVKIKDQIAQSVQATLDKINECETQIELDGYWVMSKTNLTLSAAWKEKEKELKDAK